MRKFSYLFIFIFVGVTVVLLLVPRKGFFKPIDKGIRFSNRRLSYIQVILLISAVVSFAIMMLVKYLIQLKF